MQEIEIYISEIKVALRKCKQGGYSEATVKNALELMRELCPLLADKQAQDVLLQEMRNLVKRAKAVEKRENPPTKGAEKDGADIHAVFPLLENPYSQRETLCNFSVIESQKGGKVNAFLLYGPFEDELLYQTQCYAKAKGVDVRLVDCQRLVEMDDTDEILRALSDYAQTVEKEIFVYSNLSALKHTQEENFCYYLKKMRQTAPNLTQILLSNDPEYPFERVYKRCVDNFSDGDMIEKLSYGNLDFVFLPLPNYEFTRAQVERAFGQDKDGEKRLKKDGILLGYAGLKELLKTSSKENWKENLSVLTKNKREKLEEFYNATGENFSFVADGGWGFKISKKKKTELQGYPQPTFMMPKTDYDGIANIDEIRTNIEKILNYDGVSVQMKCPWALTYALDGGDTLNLFNLEKESVKKELKQRWELGYDALSALMKIPRGELRFDLNNTGDTDGVCVDGGRTIRLKKLFLENNDPTVLERGKKAFLHETYHALQHSAVVALQKGDREILDYYLVHFAINSQAEEWRENFSRYREAGGEGNFADYYDQVVEAEARIFANDRLREFANFHPPKLD